MTKLTYTLLLSFPLIWLMPGITQAAPLFCKATATSIAFGNVDGTTSSTATGRINWSCFNTEPWRSAYVTLCLNIGNGTGGVNASGERQMLSGTSSMNYQLYQDPADTIIWGSILSATNVTPYQVRFSIPARSIYSGSVTIYGQVPAGQTALTTGSFASTFAGTDATLTYSYNIANGRFPPRFGGFPPNYGRYPSSCGTKDRGIYFPFTATATVSSGCTVTAGPTLDLGTVPATQKNVSASDTIYVTCTDGTTYNVGLAPSNGSSTGAGVMHGSSGNTDKIPYQLYSNAALSQIWGNTASSTSTGNGISGTGTGVQQQLTVWAKVAGADFTPDTYSDTVTIYVNY